jgi:hypothetical protein
LAGFVLAGCHHDRGRYGGQVAVAYNQPQPQPVIVEQAPPPIIVQQAPPPVIYEAPPPPPPEVGFVFIAGYNHWDGGHWGWVRGHYERPPHANARWVAPQYHEVGGQHHYVTGHWVGASGYGHH